MGLVAKYLLKTVRVGGCGRLAVALPNIHLVQRWGCQQNIAAWYKKPQAALEARLPSKWSG